MTSAQEHAGTADGSTPAVQYSVDDGAGGGSDAAYVRPTQITYPNGRQVDYAYESPHGENSKRCRIPFWSPT